jgi:hypothetical protein
LEATLKKWGFKLNEYNKCIANITINGQQCNIIWLVDNLKILHAPRKVIEDIIAQLDNKFGKEIPLTTACGKVLEYLSMMLDYSTKGNNKISKYEYIDKLLSELPMEMNGSGSTPAAQWRQN